MLDRLRGVGERILAINQIFDCNDAMRQQSQSGQKRATTRPDKIQLVHNDRRQVNLAAASVSALHNDRPQWTRNSQSRCEPLWVAGRLNNKITGGI